MDFILFEKNDRLYHHLYKWCIVKEVDLLNKQYLIQTEEVNKPPFLLHIEEDTVQFFSYAEYTMKGFTRKEKPQKDPEIGSVIWVRDGEGEDWQVTIFMGRNSSPHTDYPILVDRYGRVEPKVWLGYRYFTTENPFLDNIRQIKQLKK